MVFVLLGAAASAVGALLFDLREWIARIGGVVVIISDLLEKAVPSLGDRTGLLSSVQYVPELLRVKQSLAAKGVEAIIGEGDTRIAYPGQVLGCNFPSASR